ncbi:tautomerase family protein [Novosphingobium sp. MMS21-SN21R]|uniref:tautomerase family protein n=1 Tax=Novosphingobium sp. MMS21-SN21R TaxID=2969298 RepID=UPI002887E421|nr:tautomerase family protein [Novosphingobium sp. MMS21-SN21R]MDT0506814.1 tautomerase family protein [Novosphingobium sp. MMS21-SN21R]
MPHVIVKLWPGKSDEQKSRLADSITRGVTSILSYGDDAVSVAFEEVAPSDWTEQVYNPDILGKWNALAKEPGYGPGPTDQRSPS